MDSNQKDKQLLHDGSTTNGHSNGHSNGGTSSVGTANGVGESHHEEQSPSVVLYIAVLCCCFSPFLFGYTIGYTSPTQATMIGDTTDSHGVLPPADLQVLTTNEFSLYASLLNIGAVLGALSGSTLAEKLGRKKTLLLTAVPHIAGWVGTACVSNAAVLIFLRMLIGWGVGVGSAVTPVYIGEVSTTGLRGALGAANQLSVTFGIFFANLAGTYVFLTENDSQQFVQWRYMGFLAGAIALLLGTVLAFPESPKWLAKQGRTEECRAALQKLRRGNCSMEAEAILDELQNDGAEPEAGNANPSSAASMCNYKKSLIVGIGLCIFQQISGVNAVMMYTASICSSAGMSNAKQAAMLVMGLQVVLTGIACLLMERAGRRTLLLFGSSAMSLSCFALSYYFLAQSHDGMWTPSWLAIGGIVLFIVGFSLALGPIPWLIMPEVFPTEVRSSACSLATAANWSFSFLVTESFLPLEDAITKEGVFLLFAIVSACCFTFVLFLVPETKGLSVEEVLQAMQMQRASTDEARTLGRGTSLQQAAILRRGGTPTAEERPHVVSVQ